MYIILTTLITTYFTQTTEVSTKYCMQPIF